MIGWLATLAFFAAGVSGILGGVHLTAQQQVTHAEQRTHQRCGVVWAERQDLPTDAQPHVAGFSRWWGDHFIVCHVDAATVDEWQRSADNAWWLRYGRFLQ